MPMLFEIINPSDKMTMEADDTTVAGVAALYLGEGKIGLENEQGETVFPLLFLGGQDALDEWKSQVGIDDLSVWTFEHKDEIACCLESIVYGGFGDRRAVMELVEGKEHHEILQAMAKWNDRQRSSINDFSSYAFKLAKRVREMEDPRTAE